MSGYDSINLKGQAAAAGSCCGGNYSVKGARSAAKTIMRIGSGTAKRKRSTLNAGIDYFTNRTVVNKCAAGGKDHTQAETTAVCGNIVKVGSEHRLAAGENDNRLGKSSDIVQ